MNVRQTIIGLREKFAGEFNLNPKNLQLMLIIVIILLVNLVSLTLNFRIDLTRNRIYSLSEKSKEVVGNLNEKLTIRVLFSKDLPAQHNAVFRYLQDLLEEYDYYGNRNFRYEIVPDKDLEKTATEYGVSPVMSKEFVSDQVKLRRTYMGLVIQQADVIEKINTVANTSGIEFSITSLMQKVSSRVDGLLKLERPIEVRLYYDSNLKYLPIEGITDLADKIEKTVQKCNLQNYDKLSFKLVQPASQKEGQDIAARYGLSLLTWKGGVGTFDKMVPAGDYLLGIVMENAGKFEAIDIGVAPTITGKNVLVGVNNLEDRVNFAVSSLVSTNPQVGYVVGHGEVELNDKQTRGGGWFLKLLLSDMYELKEIDLAAEDIPSDIQTIIINGPTSEFTPAELYKIDQFLMKGKKAIFFVRTMAEMKMPGMGMFGGQGQVLPVRTGLETLLKHYGVTVNPDYVLDKSCAKVQLEQFIADYPVVPIIKERGLLRGNIITGFLKGIAMDRVSSVELDTKKTGQMGLVTRELVKSSDESWIMKGNINLHPLLMSPPPGAEYKPRTLAVLISGRFESFFKGQEIPAAKEDKEDKKKQKEPSVTTVTKLDETIPSGKSEVIVVGTSEITTSGFLDDSDKILSSGSPREDEDTFPNGLFLHNMVDYMAGNFYVPEMRNKRLDYNPLDRVPDAMKSTYKIINIAGLPVMVVLFGFFTWRRLHVRRKMIQKEFSKEG